MAAEMTAFVIISCMAAGCHDPKIGSWVDPPEMPMDDAIQYGAEHNRVTGHTVEFKNQRIEVRHGG